MSTYETERLQNIARNRALIKELGIPTIEHEPKTIPSTGKKRKRETALPTRVSARIASATRASYNSPSPPTSPRRTQTRKPVKESPPESPPPDLETMRENWSSWDTEASPPSRDTEGTFHFTSHPLFLPNKSPSEILREGAFGGTYFRPLYSRTLRTTISDDWRELPTEWTEGLNVDRYLTSNEYNTEVNKYGVACGQSIEEWEKAGWIRHEFDVRGWFQWYCRFWMGRRCADDERQISRWRKCVGEAGRWRRVLLKKYIKEGVRSVFDDDVDEDRGEVSPVVHQTCHHWAWEVKQEVLDEVWAEHGRV